MDPVSHATFGLTLIRAVGPREGRVRGVTAAIILGALSPDIDAIVMPSGWDRYLRVHEIGTHTIVGVVVCGLLTAGLVWLFVRRRYQVLAAVASIAAASHLLLDLLSSAHVKPGWPIVDTVVSLPVVAMADPWMLALCVCGAATAWVPRARGRGAAVALVMIAAFVLVKGAVGGLAFRSYVAARDRAGDAVVARVIEAEWASLSSWRVFDRTSQRLRAWRVRPSEPAELVFSWPLTQDPPVVTASRNFMTVKNFLHSHALSFAIPVNSVAGTFPGKVPATDPGTVPATEAATDAATEVATTEVLWSDVRFCWQVGTGTSASGPIAESREQTRLACALWFGGELDARGQPLREIIKIGGFTQTRVPSR